MQQCKDFHLNTNSTQSHPPSLQTQTSFMNALTLPCTVKLLLLLHSFYVSTPLLWNMKYFIDTLTHYVDHSFSVLEWWNGIFQV